jgi:hypothetical protein
MYRGCLLIFFLAACLAQEHTDPTVYPVGGVSIPAELTSTIRAERVHRGDPVEFRTVEAVLISKGLVMPENGAAPLQGDKPSWLVLLVERAEWKNQSVLLHAFIAAQITVSQLANQSQTAGDGGTTPRDPRRIARESGRVAALNGVDMSSSTHLPEDSRSGGHSSAVPAPAPLKELRIARDENGIVYLVSQHANVKLPRGTLFRLQNQLVPASPADGHPSPP